MLRYLFGLLSARSATRPNVTDKDAELRQLRNAMSEASVKEEKLLGLVQMLRTTLAETDAKAERLSILLEGYASLMSEARDQLARAEERLSAAERKLVEQGSIDYQRATKFAGSSRVSSESRSVSNRVAADMLLEVAMSRKRAA